jgi:transposase
MATRLRSRKATRKFLIQKPDGQVTQRVKIVGPEHFGILSFDCAKARSKFMLANFYGTVLIPPQTVEHTRGHLQAALDLVRKAIEQHGLRDLIVAIERTGEYHRPVQRACKQAGFDTRLVHPLTSKQFRMPADPANKTDDTDLAAIFRAAVNGFGLIDPVLPEDYQQLQLLIRHRRDLVFKTTTLCNQIREQLHALMPGYAECFSDVWASGLALPLARVSPAAEVLRQDDGQGLLRLIAEHQLSARRDSFARIFAWAQTAPAAHPQHELRRQFLCALDDDRLSKTQQIAGLESQIARYLAGTPYVLLLVIPGINVVSAADVAGELGPITLYAHANAITGRAGLVPARYQSDQVDHADGPLHRRANRRLRAALMQVADNLVACNHHFRAKAAHWTAQGKDARWIRVKVAKNFSRLLFAMVAGRQLFPHPCRQERHYILHKLMEFHRLHDTPMPQVLADLDAATQQLPRSAYVAEAQPLEERLKEVLKRKGPQPLTDILPIVLARLGSKSVQSTTSEASGPS